MAGTDHDPAQSMMRYILRAGSAIMNQRTRMPKRIHNLQGGFTLIELLIVMAITIVVGGMIVVFQNDLFSVNDFLQQSLSLQRDAEAVARDAVSELRSATQSGLGAYPLEIVGSSSIAFYADIDLDAAVERVHYFVNGTELWKSVVKPGGSPLTYSTTTSAEETVSVVLMGLAASTTPPFLYFDRYYAGTTTPLAQPVDASAVRLVQITFVADRDARPPPAIVVSSQVNIRNLRDN